MRHFLLPLALSVLLVSSCGCTEKRYDEITAVVLEDPNIVTVDVDAPFTDFSGWHGSILLTEGWGKRESIGKQRDWESFAWATAGTATFYAVLPYGGQLDLHARCIPFPNGPYLRDGKLPMTLLEPRQTIALVWKARTIGSVRLSGESWQTIRIQLPDDLPRGTLERFAFRFSRLTKPSEVSGHGDEPLAAAFSEIAIVPRRTADPRRVIETLKDRYEGGLLRLPAGLGWEVPMPAAARVKVRFSIREVQCSTCELRIEYLRNAGRREVIWRPETATLQTSGLLEAPETVEFEFETDGNTVGRLRFTVIRRRYDDTQTPAYVDVSIPGDMIQSVAATGDRKRPNVFVYLIDTLRADALAPYGGPVEISPRIHSFAADAVTYKCARTPTSWTLPSVVSLLTGVYPRRHHIMKGDIRYTERVSPSVVGRLANAGYQTLAVSQSFVFGPAYGLDSSFSSFFLNDHLNSYALRSGRVRRFLLQWLHHRATLSEPIFVYIHTVGPHAPYAPPPEFRGLAESAPGRLPREEYLPLNFMVRGHGQDETELDHLRALYLGEVMYADREFGKFVDLLKYLGLYDNSLIVLVSDHGEEFAEHGGFEHGRTLYEEQLRVPLIIKYPNSQWAGMEITDPVSTIDVASTVLEYVGTGADALPADGRALPPLGDPRRGAGGRVLAAELDVPPAEHRAAVNYRSVIRATTKCIQSLNGQDQFGKPVPQWQLFDLDEDPGERRPTVSGASVTSACTELLTAWQAGRHRQAPGKRGADKASQKSLERLRSLGYVK